MVLAESTPDTLHLWGRGVASLLHGRQLSSKPWPVPQHTSQPARATGAPKTLPLPALCWPMVSGLPTGPAAHLLPPTQDSWGRGRGQPGAGLRNAGVSCEHMPLLHSSLLLLASLPPSWEAAWPGCRLSSGLEGESPREALLLSHPQPQAPGPDGLADGDQPAPLPGHPGEAARPLCRQCWMSQNTPWDLGPRGFGSWGQRKELCRWTRGAQLMPHPVAQGRPALAPSVHT